MKIAAIFGAGSGRVNPWVDKARNRIASGRRLLVNQGHEAGPARRGKTGAGPGSGATPHVAIEVVEVRFHRHVRHIPELSGTSVRRGGHTGLPTWNLFAIRTDTTAALVPGGFGGQCAPCAVRGETGAADCRNPGAFGRIVIRDGWAVSSIIARRCEDTLPLSSEFLEDVIIRR